MAQSTERDSDIEGDSRLPPGVRPTHYALHLQLDPDSADFSGHVCIDVDLAHAQRAIQLHGQGMLIDAAVARRGDRAIALSPRFGSAGGLLLSASSPLDAGAWTLDLRWRAPLGEVPEGLYRVRQDGRAYIFSQFEPLAARKAFPCFDEPRFKAPFAITLDVPPDTVALANGPAMKTDMRPSGQRVVFTPTAPLPTYLVAFAVGAFEVVTSEDDTNRPGGAPLRVITTAGRSHLARYALDTTPALLDALARRCGRPMPYPKLDLVGVPDFTAGAMENVGLVTFRERLLLLDSKRASASDRYWVQLVVAHELAHMWFGNLVTMTWWDDLWLNEAFATDLESWVVDDVCPGFDARLEAVRETGAVMDHDALAEARAVRQPIVDGGDVLNAFDGITYGKGAALLRMTRAWLGDDAFDHAVHVYLDAHAHGTAGTEDLLGEFERSAGQPVSAVLASFLDQPGVPLVEVRPIPGDRRTFELSQRRFGTKARSGGLWRIPLTLKFGRGDDVHQQPVMLSHATQRVTLPIAPDWLHPNADEASYVRWLLPEAALDALLVAHRDRLSLAEQVALPSHLWALLELGALSIDATLRGFTALARARHRLVVGGVTRGLRRIARQVLRPSHIEPFARWTRGLLRAHLDRIGLHPRGGESDHDALMRADLLNALVDIGHDTAVAEAMSESASQLLDDLAMTDAARVQSALPLAALRGDAALWRRLFEAIPEAPSPGHRVALIRALGSFADPALAERGFEAFLDARIRAQDVFTLLRPADARASTRARLFGWLDRRYAAVVKKIGDEMAAHLPELFSGSTTEAERDRLRALFAPEERHRPGLERPLRQTLESIERNARLARRIGGRLVAYLDRIDPNREATPAAGA